MSRKVSSFIMGVQNVVLAPLSKRQKKKTMARLYQDLGRKNKETLKTPAGDLQFYSLRGHETASAIAKFEVDEPETISWICEHIKPNERLWDIGANIGLYSCLAGKRGIQVSSFEPSALNFSLLVEHIHLNSLDECVSPFCVALGSETKVNYLHMSNFETGHASNSLAKASNQFSDFKTEFKQSIPTFTATDFCQTFNIPAPDHIKLDVDGLEPMILKGLIGILPMIKSLSIEVEGQNAETANQWLEPVMDAAGLKEDMSHRQQGHQRNRLYKR
jgi:FkbM family methyltransferase